jgi:site-specific recombinase XerD
MKFFYRNVLQKDFPVFNILKPQKEKKLQCVLSREEVYRVLKNVKTIQNHAFLSTIYACGLRLQEGLHLQVTDIDADRMQIHVHRGKCAKDRFIPLPKDILILLRKYW